MATKRARRAWRARSAPGGTGQAGACPGRCPSLVRKTRLGRVEDRELQTQTRVTASSWKLAVVKEGPPSPNRRNTPVDYQHHSPTPGAERYDRYEHFGCAPCWNAPSSGVVTLVPNLPFRNPVSLFEDVVVLGGALPPCFAERAAAGGGERAGALRAHARDEDHLLLAPLEGVHLPPAWR